MQTLTNPNGAFGQVDEGALPRIAFPFFATTGTIAAGSAVALVFDAATATIKAVALDTDASGQTAQSGKGVATEAITTTRSGLVVTHGFARVNVDSATPAANGTAIGTTTAGVAGVTATPDATFVAGTGLGKYLGAKNSANLAPIWVSPS